MKIGFTGPFCDNNFGDYAMLVNDIMDICENLNEKIDDIVLFCYDGTFLKKMKEHYLQNYPVSLFEVRTHDSNKEVLAKSDKFVISYKKEHATPMEIVSQIENIEELEEQVAKIDIMILAGGGCINYYWLAEHRRNKLFSILAPLIVARNENKKLVSMGNTFGPWGENEEFFFMLLNYIQFEQINVRDNLFSRPALNKIGISDGITDIVDDIYFFNHRFKKQERIVKEKYIVLELYAALNDLELLLPDIRDFVKSMEECYGYKTIFLPFGRGFGGEKQGEYLCEKIPELAFYKSKEEFLTIEDAVALISNAEFVLCDRYHAFVLALAANVPCIQYLREIDGSRQYYYNKCCGMLRKLRDNCDKTRKIYEKDFLVTELKGLFIADKIKLDNTIHAQKSLYTYEKQKVEKELKASRLEFITSELCL